MSEQPIGCAIGKMPSGPHPPTSTTSKSGHSTGWEVYQAAKARDQELVAELTNDLATGCANCHSVYRDKDDRCIPDFGVTRQ